MLYENFIKWLFYKKPQCEHEWCKIGFKYGSFSGKMRDIYTCKKCNKKEKRDPRASYIYW